MDSEYIYLALGAMGLLLTFSQKTRYFAKLSAFLWVSYFASILPIPLFIIRPRDYRNGLLPAWCCRLICNLLGATFEIRGLENINKSKGGVVLINHQSCMDLVVIAHLWPVIGRATTVVRKEVLYLFPFGLASYLWGTLFIDRSNPRNAVDKLSKEAKSINEHGSKLLLFPEGTRNEGDKLLPFKKGAFNIAVQSQSMLQPIVVSRFTFLSYERKWFGRGHNIISILPEIDCKGMTKEDIPRVMEEAQTLMQNHYTELNTELRKSMLKNVN